METKPKREIEIEEHGGRRKQNKEEKDSSEIDEIENKNKIEKN